MIRYFIFLVFTSLSSCNLGPNYEYPAVDLPENYKNETASEIDVAALPDPFYKWWTVFDEENLNELEEAALQNNPDLEQALWRVEEAWGLAGLSRSDLFPNLSLAPVYNNTGSLIRLFRPPANTFPPGFDFPSIPYRAHQLLFTLPVNLNYELDLWGRLRKEYEAGKLNAISKEEAYRASLLTLTTQVASSYFNLKVLTSQIRIYQETIDNREKNVAVARKRYENGLTNELEMTSTEVELANNRAGLNEALRQKGIEINRLAVLIGKNPSTFCIELPGLNKKPPKINAGLPSTLLLARPDLAEAERTRAAQHARIGSAWASYFPSITLTGALGFLSPTTHDFMTWLSRYWSMNAYASQNLFDGGERESNLEIACSRFQQADRQYQSLVLTAFKEVEDALNNLRFQALKQQNYLDAKGFAEKSYTLSTKRYNQGLTNLIEQIDYQRSYLNADLDFVASLGEEYQATLQLIKALGGVYNCSDGGSLLE